MDTPAIYYQKLLHERTRPIDERFPGFYRAMVVDTNDPLNMGRVRFLCPEMHNIDLSVADAPFALPSPTFGGPRSGVFNNPCIGDTIWISFEKQHPFGPIWTAGADPTRQRFYTRWQVTNPSPVSLSVDAEPQGAPDDFDIDYLPKDGRPMCFGSTDRYGTTSITSSVGFYPKTHATASPPSEYDPFQASVYNSAKDKPEINQPDKKYNATITKYGNIVQLSDVGYYWYKQDGVSEFGEFQGDPTIDENFENERFKQLQRLLNEDKPSTSFNGNGIPGTDQRKSLIQTRYGHKWEQRDTGYAQPGPISNKARLDEYGAGQYLSKETQSDMRWVKWRTKAGNLYQMLDIGSDPAYNLNISRTNLEDCGFGSEKEDVYFANKDARMIRIISSGNLKFVLDDRGSDVVDPTQAWPCSNGILLKGKRPAGANGVKPVQGIQARATVTVVDGAITKIDMVNNGTEYTEPPDIQIIDPTGSGSGVSIQVVIQSGQITKINVLSGGKNYKQAVIVIAPPPYARGFYLEFNENDLANRATLGSPLGSIFELNDRYQYSIISNGLGKTYTRPCMGIKENEFLRSPSMEFNPELGTYHLKLDLQNEYLRLKSRGGLGVGPDVNGAVVNPSGVVNGIPAGLEVRDGIKGDGPWVELVDSDSRGFWFSKENNIGVWRGKNGKKLYFIIDDSNDSVTIFNGESGGQLNLYSAGSINIRAEQKLNMYAGQGVSLSSPQGVVLAGGNSRIGVSNNSISGTNATSVGVVPPPTIPDVLPSIPSKLEPTDRGAVYNGPFEACPVAEIEHKLDSLFSQHPNWLPPFARLQ